MRFLYTFDSGELVAHAPGRRDFFKEGEEQPWAHDSHGWLVAAGTGLALAHRTGDVYYSADGKGLYRIAPELDAPGDAGRGSAPSGKRRVSLR